MSIAIRRARQATRNSLRIVSLANDVAVQPLVKHKADMAYLMANNFVGVATYDQAVAIKIEHDDAANWVGHNRVFIQPVRDGYVCQVRNDEPHNFHHTSEVERVNFLAEEWGTSVEDLLTSRPHLIEVSSGGNFNRL